jgi:hypothetical protein
MVKGLERFKEHFKDHMDSFVIIGGTACSILLKDLNPPFRATKDIDMILYVETLGPEFAKVFWDFIRQGRYQNKQKSTGKKVFYRFQEPADPSYPAMLELFSSRPEGFELAPGSEITPLPLGDDTSSLSAILLDEVYYPFLQTGRKVVEGLPVLGAEHLIVMKAKAYLDLSQQRAKGEAVDSKKISKHQNDVFRLYPLLAEQSRVSVPFPIKEDMKAFLKSIPMEKIDLKIYGIRTQTLPQVVDSLKAIYGLVG